MRSERVPGITRYYCTTTLGSTYSYKLEQSISYSPIRGVPSAYIAMEAKPAPEQAQPVGMRYDVVKIENGEVLYKFGSTDKYCTAAKRQGGVGQNMMKF